MTKEFIVDMPVKVILSDEYDDGGEVKCSKLVAPSLTEVLDSISIVDTKDMGSSMLNILNASPDLLGEIGQYLIFQKA